MLMFLAGCNPDRFARAGSITAEAGQVPAALAVADEERRIGRTLPAYPDDCRRQHRSGVAAGDRLDAALIRTDRALARANGQIRECAGWYDEVRKGVAQ
ncbi:hypothetical protein HPDFL43_05925 [Hoeflea phototrophica DFL-43]|uniref:Uncharacterized protein n=1 Tax=Hoeflea phototrophica (strain DSM 17068 / NCIMB 14078 / DFL-43) TaxID=411684 RepID=A9D4V2_HOEPD|nr:hypothetical protein [Hoeflea phototrophica]EDQ33968.1 hypothetical protein HPDFL43_05925 [Hoeflea phototrophica DFL-43]